MQEAATNTQVGFLPFRLCSRNTSTNPQSHCGRRHLRLRQTKNRRRKSSSRTSRISHRGQDYHAGNSSRKKRGKLLQGMETRNFTLEKGIRQHSTARGGDLRGKPRTHGGRGAEARSSHECSFPGVQRKREVGRTRKVGGRHCACRPLRRQPRRVHCPQVSARLDGSGNEAIAGAHAAPN